MTLTRVDSGFECPECGSAATRGIGFRVRFGVRESRRECEHCLRRFYAPEPEESDEPEIAPASKTVRYITPNATGAACPACGAANVSTYKTMPDDGGPRLRYHRCECGQNFKSVES